MYTHGLPAAAAAVTSLLRSVCVIAPPWMRILTGMGQDLSVPPVLSSAEFSPAVNPLLCLSLSPAQVFGVLNFSLLHTVFWYQLSCMKGFQRQCLSSTSGAAFHLHVPLLLSFWGY